MGRTKFDVGAFADGLTVEFIDGGLRLRICGLDVGEIKDGGGHVEVNLSGSLPASGSPLQVGEDGFLVFNK